MDPSLTSMGGQIVGFVCTDSRNFADSSRHYWFVEVEDGCLRYAVLSLKGLQRLTQELAKKLIVTGVLLVLGPRKNPVLRTAELDSVAGVLPQIVRAPNPIRVLGRQQANKIRNFLCRAHGVKKKRHVSIHNHRTQFPGKQKGSRKAKAHLAGAVTLPGGKKKEVTKCALNGGLQSTGHKRLSATRKSKHVPVQGQIDYLLRQQSASHHASTSLEQNNPLLVEDISDEEFVEGEPRNESQREVPISVQAGHLTSKQNPSQTCVGDKLDEKQEQKGSAVIASDPIEDCSPCVPNNNSSGRTSAGNILSSPAKHKRDTERTAVSQETKDGKQVLQKEDRAQLGLPTHGAETTDLVDEGLMSNTNKKQKALPSARENDDNFGTSARCPKCPH